MQFWSVAVSDVGTKKKVNQDTAMLKIAGSPYGRIGLAVVCDGVGGLKKGELASVTMLRDVENWFMETLPIALETSDWEQSVCESLLEMTGQTDKKLKSYMAETGEQLGTTISLLLIIDRQYYILNVGDTRVYLHDGEKLQQITRDHTWIQNEIDSGRLTEAEAENSPDRSVLLQCVGASDILHPDFMTGRVEEETVFLVCSDGFRHVLTKEELEKEVNPQSFVSERKMEDRLKNMVKTIKARKEEDNISAILIKTL